MEQIQANPGKQLFTQINGQTYARIPIRTHVIQPEDKLTDVLETYAVPRLQSGDTLIISEKIVAITQGRAFPVYEIAPSWLARLLARFVTKSPHGIGVGSPSTMELAIREVGAIRIVLAALVAGVAKLFGLKGVFYRLCGPAVATIDGPTHCTLPPYNTYAILGPLAPATVAQDLQELFQSPVAIIDANDLGVTFLGVSDNCPSASVLQQAFADNPLGQSHEQTPLGIFRPWRSD